MKTPPLFSEQKLSQETLGKDLMMVSFPGYRNGEKMLGKSYGGSAKDT